MQTPPRHFDLESFQAILQSFFFDSLWLFDIKLDPSQKPMSRLGPWCFWLTQIFLTLGFCKGGHLAEMGNCALDQLFTWHNVVVEQTYSVLTDNSTK